jgi:hypothetical protein
LPSHQRLASGPVQADLLRDLVPELESGARAIHDQRGEMFELLAADRGMAAAERAGNPLLIDVARAHAQRRQVADAVAALRQAEELTPEQVHAHALVRQVVSDLLAMQNPPGADLAALSVRVAAL